MIVFSVVQDFAASSEYQSRCCLELGDLYMRVTASNDGAMQCNLSLHRLECAEHLPVSGLEAAPAAATLAEVMLWGLPLHRLECAEHLPVSGLEAAPAAATLAEVMLWGLSLHRLECAEHLPVSGPDAAPAAATLAEVT